MELRPGAVQIRIVTDQLLEAMQLGVQIVEMVQCNGFERHGKLWSAKLVFAMVAYNHVLQPEHRFAPDGLARKALSLGDFLIEHGDGKHSVSQKLARIRINKAFVAA